MLKLDKGHHTLVCGACGAPLSKLKALPVRAAVPAPAVTHQPQAAKPRKRPKEKYARPSKRQKRRKSVFWKLAEEAFDLVEDIFD